MRVRAAILILVGLITLGAVLELMVLRPPKSRTFTREDYRAFDPEHADGFSSYDSFVRRAGEDFDDKLPTWENRPLWIELKGAQYDPARAYGELKAEHSRVIVRHYFQDEIAWFFLPGGLLLLCGAFTWRLEAAKETPVSSAPRLAPLATIGAFVGVAGPLACVPGLIVAFIQLAQTMHVLHNPPGTMFMIGFISLCVAIGIFLLVMSVLGTIAIVQVRRSGGTLYGLRLALLEALFCPAIVLHCAAFGVLAALLMAWCGSELRETALPLLYALTVFVVIVAVTFTYWWLWRKLKRPPDDAATIGRDEPRKVVPPPDRTNSPSPIGRISLWTAVAGLVLPAVLGLIGNLLFRPSKTFFVLNCALWIGLELVALVCGIVARRTTTGKAGLIVSVNSLAFFVVVLLLLFRAMQNPVAPAAPSTVTATLATTLNARHRPDQKYPGSRCQCC